MKIQDIGAVKATEKKKKINSTANSGAFADALASASDDINQVAATTPPPQIMPMNAIIATQMPRDDLLQRQALVRYGNDMLDELQMLQKYLLLGAVTPQNVQKLATLVRQQKDPSSDPKLEQILDEIELRVEVELAKLGQ